MGNLIVYEEREVKAKGLNRRNQVNEEKLQEYFFEEDYQSLKLLKKLPRFDLNEKENILFYPGCGADIFYPLHYLELFPEITEIKLIFVDENDSLSMIKTELDDVGIGFEEKKNTLHFYWKEKLIHLEFIKEEIKKAFPKIPAYHIYFEKAFRIMRENILNYEQSILDKLLPGGVLISDSGFENKDLEYMDIPAELSAYGEMVIGKKNNRKL
jgi:hypothetical protein